MLVRFGEKELCYHSLQCPEKKMDLGEKGHVVLVRGGVPDPRLSVCSEILCA